MKSKKNSRLSMIPEINSNNKARGPLTNIFKKFSIWFFFRECVQNFFDACIGLFDKSKNEVPTIVFRSFTIPTDDLPHINDFKKQIELMKNSKHYKGEKKGVDLYNQISDQISKNNQRIICISDPGKGMDVNLSDETEGSLASYIRDYNTTEKDVKGGTGGNFGEGSEAAFAPSKLCTVFVSTYPENNGNIETYFMGKTQLFSRHSNDKKEKYCKDIMWAEKPDPSYNNWEVLGPCSDINDFPSWARRDPVERGTDIYSIGVSDDDWYERGLISLLCNYSLGIYRKNYNAQIKEDDESKREITIQKDNVFEIFQNIFEEKDDFYKNVLQISKNIHKEDTLIEAYYTLMLERGDEGYNQEFIVEAGRLGKCRLKVRFYDEDDKDKFNGLFQNYFENHKNRISIYRNGGMLICNGYHPDVKWMNLKVFKNIKRDFIGFLEFDVENDFLGKDIEREYFGEGLVQTLEPPKHDALIEEQMEDHKKYDEEKKSFIDLARKLKKQIKDFFKSNDENEFVSLDWIDMMSFAGKDTNKGPISNVNSAISDISKKAYIRKDKWWKSKMKKKRLRRKKRIPVPITEYLAVETKPNSWTFEITKPVLYGKKLDLEILFTGSEKDVTQEILSVSYGTKHLNGNTIKDIPGKDGTKQKFDVVFPPSSIDIEKQFKVVGYAS